MLGALTRQLRSSSTVIESQQVSARLCRQRVSYSFIHCSTPNGAICMAARLDQRWCPTQIGCQARTSAAGSTAAPKSVR